MENAVEVVAVPVIAAIVYGVMAVYRQLVAGKAAVWTSLIPVWAGILGTAIGVIAFSAILLGLASGLSATGADQVYKQIKKSGGGEA